MLTLGIETSCDETSCAVLEGKDKILSNIVSSSLFRHKPFGGIVPEIASRHCLEQIDVVFEEALNEAKIQRDDVGLIAVTQGPGLIGSLLVGISFAKGLAYQMKRPLVGVNHLEAHLAANFIGKREPAKYVGLLASGGHTSLSFHERGKVRLMGATVDDAVGEAYDKVAKMMGLGYPGGPILDKLASSGNPERFHFSRPKQKNPYDFSFSGIKTAVLYEIRKIQSNGKKKKGIPGNPFSVGARHAVPLHSGEFIRDMAASFQRTVVDWLGEKTLRLAEDKEVQDVAVGGGVSANSWLRKILAEEGERKGIRVWFPTTALSLDNAAMIARRGAELYETGKRSSFRMTGNPGLEMGKN